MGDQEEDPCKKVSRSQGTSNGNSAEYDWDVCWDKAMASARHWAAIDAERWAMAIVCPLACSYRQLDIEIGDPTDPNITRGRDSQGHPIWNGTSQVDWTATVTCVAALPGDDGTAEGEGTGVSDGGEHRRAACDEKVRFDDTSQGAGASVVQADPQAAAAIKEAKDKAQEQAYREANRDALGIRCRYRCRLRTVSIIVAPPQAGNPQKETVEVTLSTGLKKPVEFWVVHARCQWKLRVTCHD